MPFAELFADIFPPGYWERIDRSILVEDSHSHFGDGQVFDWIITQTRPETIVEIGSWKGHSANFMADICKREGLNTKIICVDTFNGSEEHWSYPPLREELHIKNGRPTILERFMGNTVARGNTDYVYPLPIDGQSAAALFATYSAKADLIFIDAGHAYEMVVNDIKMWWPHLSERGVMFGDDYHMWMVGWAAHAVANELNVPVMVGMRKWVYMTGALKDAPTPAGGQVLDHFDKWVQQHDFNMAQPG